MLLDYFRKRVRGRDILNPVLNGREVDIMAIVITNGMYYIYYNEIGKHRKTTDISKAIQYDSVTEAVSYMHKAPSKTRGYCVYDTIEKTILWKPGESDICMNVKRNRHGKIVRKRYSVTARRLIYDKADGRCQLCGRKITFEDMTIDHIIPLCLNGIDNVSNLQCACYACNEFKGSVLPDDFIERITEIFIYQTGIKQGNRLLWKITHRLLNRLI